MTFTEIDPAIAVLIVASAALLFASAAVHKLRDRRQFAEIFSAYGLLPPGVRPAVSRLVPVAELVVAAGLLSATTRGYAVAAGCLLLLVYAAAITINLRRGRRDLACGCGGPDERRPIAPWMVWRNVLISALLVLAMLPCGTRPLVLTDAVTVVFGALACALVYLCLDHLLGQTARRTAELRAAR